MESNFTSPVHWENEGVEPSTTLKKTGFQGDIISCQCI